MPETKTIQDTVNGDVIDFLKEVRKGGAMLDLSEQMAEVVKAVRERGKAGQVTLTIKISPFKGDVNTLVVTDEVKAKLPPKPDNGASIFFPTEEGQMVRTDPRQQTFDGEGFRE